MKIIKNSLVEALALGAEGMINFHALLLGN
jgi:hypothetical protein